MYYCILQASGRAALRLCNLVHKARELPKEDFRREVEKELTGKGRGAVGADLLQSLQEPDSGYRAGDRDGSADAGHG